ncbi:MAG TPA: hypothetical protein VIL74_23055 [Pyrinomonadaceae bacterium]
MNSKSAERLGNVNLVPARRTARLVAVLTKDEKATAPALARTAREVKPNLGNFTSPAADARRLPNDGGAHNVDYWKAVFRDDVARIDEKNERRLPADPPFLRRLIESYQSVK